MAARPLDRLGLAEAELRALAQAAWPRLAGRGQTALGKYRRKTPAHAGGDFQGLREYRPGDSLRTVNWLASARSRAIQTQTYESERASRWHICLDGSASMGLDADKWRLARQAAAAFAYCLLYSGNPVGLMVFSGKLDAFCPPGRGHSQWPRLLGLLESRETQGSAHLAVCAGRLPAGTSVLLLSDFLDAGGLREGLGRWQAMGLEVQAIQVLAEDECGLPAGGALVVRDCETAAQRLLEASPGVLGSARARLEALSAELQGYCAQRQMACSLLTPAIGWKAGLLGHFQRLRPP